jgi:glutamate/tyrosine decarboxylase-like PLP-dependent enzyme
MTPLNGPDVESLLRSVADASARYLASVGDRKVRSDATIADVRRALDRPLAEIGDDVGSLIEQLIGLGESATVATAGPRYFGFVIGGTLPAALAAELLTVAWDQNTAMAVMSPLGSVAEEIAGRWIVESLCLPPSASIGFVTGGQSANTTCLAVARHHVLDRHGWDVEARGLNGAPPVHVVVGAERHATVDAALRVLGLGSPTVVVDADDQGRMRVDAYEAAVRDLDGPLVVCAQAGNVVTGAFDPFPAIVELTHRKGGWVHVDGAFGAWAAASPGHRHLTEGMSGADSWAVDGHKMLNVPYDCGYALTAHPASHRAACAGDASYYMLGGDDVPRDGIDWVLDASRRARGIATYAALRALGRAGLADLVDRCCAHARRVTAAVAGEPGIEVVNDVVLNQVVLRFDDDDEHTRAVIAAVQEEGTCWLGGATWHGAAVMRWSVSNWSTTAEDIDRSVAAVIGVHRELRSR